MARGGAARVAVSRYAEFAVSYCHRLPELDGVQNGVRFGAAARSPGATVGLWVTVAGPVDAYGMVVNLSTVVKGAIAREVLGPLDGAYLNDVWPEFETMLPAPESLAWAIWGRLARSLDLVRVRVQWRPTVWADYGGEGMDALLTIETQFCAAHRLSMPGLSLEENYAIYGKCARPSGHGHNYKLAVTVRGPIDPRTGMVAELVAFERLVNEVLVEELDHSFLNADVPHFAMVVPTAENIALYARDRLAEPLRSLGVELYKIRLYETDKNVCEVYGEGYGKD